VLGWKVMFHKTFCQIIGDKDVQKLFEHNWGVFDKRLEFEYHNTAIGEKEFLQKFVWAEEKPGLPTTVAGAEKYRDLLM
jgi:hypothetical protein